MLTFVYVISTIFVIAVGAFYMNSVTKVNKQDLKAKDAGSVIDTCLWDMNHGLKQIVQKLEEVGSAPELDNSKAALFGIGMTPDIQMILLKDVEARKEKVYEALLSSPLKDSEEIKKLQVKIDMAKNELIAAGLDYNRKVGIFNSTISHFPASFIARRRSKRPKNLFIYYANEDKQ